MVEAGSILLGVVAILSALFRAFLKPKFDQAGFFRVGNNRNNEHCSTIGLEACEDIWVDQPSGLAYLACSSRTQRSFWETGLGILDAEKLPPHSLDYVAILDLKTQEHRKVELVNLPPGIVENGIYVHGIDLFITSDDPADSATTNQIDLSDGPAGQLSGSRRATIYLINHQPPSDRKSAPLIGAQSVIEVFDTILGDSKATYRRTIKHELILTPNNLVGISETGFYVTNDHSSKTAWTRRWEPFLTDSEIDSIIFCSFKDEINCIPAVSGKHPHPNGIAKGPGDSLYMVTTYDPYLRVFEMQADHTLALTDEVKLPRVVDNIYVTPTGSVFLAGIPSLYKFKKRLMAMREGNFDMPSPSDVWKISNETGSDAFYGGRLKIEQVLSDDGRKISGNTGVAVWGSKLYLTGLASPYVSVCKIDVDLAQ
ncbi:hypothetical protein PCANC_25588 [Puccinia coronata f. sp. avenae]|uniref:SMP-30/Gluconolactonase/LRE-like region domain-containing protein n=1 Tax=Puccinia coronata f. sp. avenae TaxID=200324 RepID=A0A2N5TMB0_9BASI|nr:hypothetical protein PCANC_24214 [Puccinia coronata f. sp. avenae]PLW26641.1 hypothetical protein PCANC_25588 [Puccinia coronata f. sp. avenae]PLW28825.1 hypothetical protein PCASD_17843 [Puccinia coronata f. sp. avenae]